MKSHISSHAEYEQLWQESVQNPMGFWDKKAKELLDWQTPYSCVSRGSFKDGDVAWFVGGELNVSYNCVDRHAIANPDKTALIWEADEPGHSQKISYSVLLQEVSLDLLNARSVDAPECYKDTE